MDHSNRAKTFLRLREDCAFLFLNRSRFATNPMRKKINGANNQGNDGQRNHRELPMQPQHDEEGSDQRDYRREYIGESFVVDRPVCFRSVRELKTGTSRTPSCLKFIIEG